MSRNETVDVLKGLCLYGMVLVNSASADKPGFLAHAGPKGPLTFADTLFPGFVFASGMTSKMPTSLQPLLRRTLQLGVFGVLLNVSARPLNTEALLDFSTYRLPSVLGRIGLSTSVASLDAYFPPLLMPVTLVGTWYALRKKFSDAEESYTNPGQSLDARLDSAVFQNRHLHQSKVPFDPEGLLASLLMTPLTAIAGKWFSTFLFEYSVDRITSQYTGASSKAISWLAASLLTAFSSKLMSSAFTALTSQPPSKIFWNPAFIFETSFTSIAGYCLSQALILFERNAPANSLSEKLLCSVVSNLKLVGRNSLEFYMLSTFLERMVLKSVTVYQEKTVWECSKSALKSLGLSSPLSGIAVSFSFAVGVSSLVKVLHNRKIHLRS